MSTSFLILCSRKKSVSPPSFSPIIFSSLVSSATTLALPIRTLYVNAFFARLSDKIQWHFCVTAVIVLSVRVDTQKLFERCDFGGGADGNRRRRRKTFHPLQSSSRVSRAVEDAAMDYARK